jgi:predicted nucleic acid-binding protein
VILVDTTIWIGHLRRGDRRLAALLDGAEVLGHPSVSGELALGDLAGRDDVLRLLDHLPQATPATAAEVRVVVDAHGLHGHGIGYVDAQLLAATLLTEGATLWTRDRRLRAAAGRAGVAYDLRG